MKRQLFSVIALFFVSLFSTQSALYSAVHNKFFFESLNINDGLSQSSVTCIIQDSKGFIWFSTKDGLNRYDGLSFQIFKKESDNKHGLGNSFITCIYEDINKNLWVGTDAGVYIYDVEREIFEKFSVTSNEKGTKIDRSVTKIGNDKNGNIWFAVESQGMFHYDIKTNSLQNYILSDGLVSANIECFTYDDNGKFWVGSFGDGLYFSENNLETLTPFLSSEGKAVFEKDIITKIEQGPYGYLYVSSVKGGLKEINLSSKKVRDLLLYDGKGEQLYIRDFIFNNHNEIWLGTENGIIIYNLRTGIYSHHRNSIHDPYSISDNAIYALFKDREGGIWIGSYFGGVNYYSKQYTLFEKYYPQNEHNSIKSKRVREFCMGNDGIIWIGTEDGGLNKFDPVSKTFSFFEPSKNFTNIHGLCFDGDYLWIGTFMKGLKVLNTKTGQLKSYSKGETPNSLNDNNIFSICKTKTGDIFLGTLFGLHRYNKSSDDFTRISQLDGKFVYDILEDSFGDMWVATYANGAYRYDVNKNKWINYQRNESLLNTLPSNKVLGIYEDSQRQIWLTTQGGGICKYNRENNSFERYPTSLNLSNEVVYQIIEDNDRNMWLTTNKGLVCFNPSSGIAKSYTIANGLLTNQFNYRSALKDNKGNLYFGSIEGFVVFDPKSFSENNYVPSVTFTDFLIHNKKVPVGVKGSPLQKSITFSDHIKLSASQNSFSLRVAALSFYAPHMNQIKYKLEGFDKEWRLMTESPVITYSNLQHGSYVFRAKASNSDGVWSDEFSELHIEIMPPFYLTTWAYCVYFILLVSLTIYVLYYIKRRNDRRHYRQMEKFERSKEREIYNAKIDFFTNLAHEIRTPLTLIKGPLDSILLRKKHTEEFQEDINVMSQNTNRLLSLVNQLLDFRKTETKGFRLNFIECNISEILKETYKRFSLLAKEKTLKFDLEIPDEDFYAHVDKEAFTKILSNLFNNAIKYSQTYIHIRLIPDDDLSGGSFKIVVANDGLVVPKEFRQKIFKPFVQYSEAGVSNVARGTGIGLVLARSLAELHQGSLNMEEVFDKNTFSLSLPTYQDSVIKLPSDIIIEVNELDDYEHNSEFVNHGKPTILIAEDNPEMLMFIKKQMKVYYSVMSAPNGKRALEILDTHDINLIISDIVMPEMDGFELCQIIKSNINYSHIPIILLTAKTNIQSKIEGLELGADAYIEKPFEIEFLLASVANLIQNREKLREAFASSPFISANTMALTKADEEFLQKLIEIVQVHFQDPEFSMDDMAEKLNMSRSSFYRKIKGVINLSPNEYLRVERLKKAAQLLQEGEYQVNEICYMVGFSSPSYFAKCFQKQFGVLPKDFSR